MDTKTLKSTSLKIVLSTVLSPLSSPMQDPNKDSLEFVSLLRWTHTERRVNARNARSEEK